MHPQHVRADHCTSQYRLFADSYWPGPVGLRYSPREVCTSVARGTLTEMILALEHTQENPIVVDEEETAVSNSSGEELEVEENEVAIPIPAPGRLIPIEDEVQVLPDELVDTQIAFEMANEDCPPSYE